MFKNYKEKLNTTKITINFVSYVNNAHQCSSGLFFFLRTVRLVGVKLLEQKDVNQPHANVETEIFPHFKPLMKKSNF